MIRYALAVFLACSAFRTDARELSRDRPKGVPDFHTWAGPGDLPSEVGSNIRLANTVISYRLYTDPVRHGLYGFSQFRTCRPDGGGCDPEMLQWIFWVPERNRLETRMYYRTLHRTWKKLWLGRAGRWDELSKNTLEWGRESDRLQKLFALSQYLRNDGANPASLTF